MPREAHRYACVGTGLIVLDVIRNSAVATATEMRFAGGSCGNVLSILAYFGWDSNAVGRIGDDHFGRELVADLARWHVKTELLHVDSGRGTPVFVQENYLDAKGRRRHRFSRACPVCGGALPAYRPLLTTEVSRIAAKLPKHSAFYFDRVAPGTLELARKSRATGALVVFEPSGVKNERLFFECLKTAHVVKYANDRLIGVQSTVSKARVPVEIETLGENGLRLRVRAGGHAGTWKYLPAFDVPELRDASGAGDWTTAGLIHGLMSRYRSADEAAADPSTVEIAVKHGQALAALNCGFEGARGLMYVAESKKVLELAGSIVKGKVESNVIEIESTRYANGQSTNMAGHLCSSFRALHQQRVDR